MTFFEKKTEFITRLNTLRVSNLKVPVGDQYPHVLRSTYLGLVRPGGCPGDYRPCE